MFVRGIFSTPIAPPPATFQSVFYLSRKFREKQIIFCLLVHQHRWLHIPAMGAGVAGNYLIRMASVKMFLFQF